MVTEQQREHKEIVQFRPYKYEVLSEKSQLSAEVLEKSTVTERSAKE